MIQGQLHRHVAAEAEAEHVGLPDPEVTEQRGHVIGQEMQVDVAVDVGRAAVALQFGGDHRPARGQLGQQSAERQLDGHQAAVQQHQRAGRPGRPVPLVIHPQAVDGRVSGAGLAHAVPSQDGSGAAETISAHPLIASPLPPRLLGLRYKGEGGMAVPVVDGIRSVQAMVPMRDGVRLNTFVYLPESGGPSYPVILQRTPYGITSPPGEAITDPARGWLADPAHPMAGAILRGWREITRRGYAAVYQDCRGRYGSQGEDHAYGDDAPDGFDTLEWIDDQPWSNHRVGLSGSSAVSTTALAAASQAHPSVKAFFAQVGGSSIYDDVVYEGQSIEMERLWLWIAGNIPGLSDSHRQAVMERTGRSADELADVAKSAAGRHAALMAAAAQWPPFTGSPDWMRLPLRGYPDFSVWQPYLDEIISHPAPDAFRARHNFRPGINVPGFHVTCWFDIFLTSVLAAFTELQARVGNQRLWVGPNNHHFVYESQFWPRDPYFEWFDHWLREEPTPIMDEPAVFYSPRAWVADPEHYVADDWRHAGQWPLPGTREQRWYLNGDGTLGGAPAGDSQSFGYDPRHPVPTLGGRNMLISAGVADQQPLRSLPGYGLVYTGQPLAEDLTVAGAGGRCPDRGIGLPRHRLRGQADRRSA